MVSDWDPNSKEYKQLLRRSHLAMRKAIKRYFVQDCAFYGYALISSHCDFPSQLRYKVFHEGIKRGVLTVGFAPDGKIFFWNENGGKGGFSRDILKVLEHMLHESEF